MISTGCARERSWEVRGRVEGFGDDARTVFIAHENIPGLMPAMTMPFQAEAVELRGLSVGDGVHFILHANTDSSWVTGIRPLDPDEPPLVLAEAPVRSRNPDGSPLVSGEAVPRVELVDQYNRAIALDDFRDQYLLVNFIYTRCPLPDFCPWMTRRFAELQDTLQSAYGSNVALLTVTIDPEYDNPDVLRAYAATHAGLAENWTFATGNPDEIHRLATALGVTYASSGDQIAHGLTTALIEPGGRLSTVWRGNDWAAEEVLHRLAYLQQDSIRAD